MRVSRKVFVLALIGIVAGTARFNAQDRLAKMPGVDHYRKMQPIMAGGTFVSGAITPTWAEDGKSFTYNHGGTRYRFDVETMAAVTGLANRAIALLLQGLAVETDVSRLCHGITKESLPDRSFPLGGRGGET